MKIREYSKNGKDFFEFYLKKRYFDERKNNPCMKNVSYERYKIRYFDYVKRNRLKTEIVRERKNVRNKIKK